MPSIVVIGAHWGDEGKGKIVDLLAQNADVVVRFSGGDNAGHTVVNDKGHFGLHMVPSGIFAEHTRCVIGNGVALNAASLLAEVESLRSAGVDLSRLRISDKAHLVLSHHPRLDGIEERVRGEGAIGTTKRGIGPLYADKAARIGLRAGDLLHPNELGARLGEIVETKNVLLKAYGAELIDFDEVMRECACYAEALGETIQPTENLVNEAVDAGQTVLFEGAQGTLLDVDFGTYPFVTASTTTAGGVFTGSGLRPQALDRILGVFKAYTTRVGAGPMPTELTGDIGEAIRQRASEFGVTTGRARRVGWFDAVAGRYSARLNGMTEGAVTRLDVLDDLPSIGVCTAYRTPGGTIEHFPSTRSELEACEPVIEMLPGWETPTTEARTFGDLPEAARDYIRRLEELLGCPMGIVSVGPHRDATIIRGL